MTYTSSVIREHTMAVQVTIKSGIAQLSLPNKVLAKAGDVVTMKDEEFAKIPASMYSTYFSAGPTVVAGTDGVTTPGTSPTLTSAAAAGGTPTKAEFDKTVADILALKTALTGVGKALT